MPCNPAIPISCSPGDVVGGLVSGAADAAWESVCKSFADAAVTLLKAFADAFVAFPNVDLSSGGVRSVYGISLGLAGVVAVLLFLFQVARTAITHDGGALAQGVVGIGKAALAFMVTLTGAGTALVAADEVTAFIVDRSFGSATGLRDKLAGILAWTPGTEGSLLLILAVVGIVLVTVLWFELLLRNAAVAVLIATSPIPAAGMVSEATREWWSKLTASTVRLIILKPVIALVFALGFGLAGNAQSEDLGSLLAGMLVLLLAALAWPAIARFFTFAAAHTGGGTGLAAVLGFAAGQATGGSGGPPVGVDPDRFGQATEARTMSSVAARAGEQTTATGAAGSATGVAGGAGAVAGGAATAGTTLVLAKGLDVAQRAANSLVGRMEQTAGHAGLSGASPHAHPAGYARGVPPMGRPVPPAPAEPAGPPIVQPTTSEVDETRVAPAVDPTANAATAVQPAVDQASSATSLSVTPSLPRPAAGPVEQVRPATDSVIEQEKGVES